MIPKILSECGRVLGFGCLAQSEGGGFVLELGIVFVVELCWRLADESFFLIPGSREER